MSGPIGVFDSGYGGLTVLRSLVDRLPGYDYLYLGDNARSPYGTRSFETVYRYTLQAVKWLLGQGCPLIILACNTASAKALRSIQQNDLQQIDPKARIRSICCLIKCCAPGERCSFCSISGTHIGHASCWTFSPGKNFSISIR